MRVADVVSPAESTGGKGALFADDLNVFQAFDVDTNNTELTRTMGICRSRVHAWGHTNRVAFDGDKEHIVVIHPIHGSGDAFKLLGCLVDCKLLMHQVIDQILSQVRPKMIAKTRSPFGVARPILGWILQKKNLRNA